MMEEQPTLQNADQPGVVQQPFNSEPPKKSHKKLFVIIGLLLAFIIAGAAIYFFVIKKDNKPEPNNQPQNNQTDNTSDKDARFYYTERPNKVVMYDMATATKSTVELTLSDERFLETSSISTNHSVQISSDGKKVFYESINPKPGGDIEPERESELLSVFEDGKEAKLMEIDADDGRGIVDWVVTRDGSKIYYLVSSPDKGDSDLRMLSVADKKDTLLKAAVTESHGVNNRMFVDQDGSLFMYANDSYEFTEHKVQNGVYASRKIGSTGCNCMLEYPQGVSPDAKKLLLEESTSGTVPSDFRYYVFDKAADKATQFGAPVTNEQWTATLWSPDTKQVVHDTSSFGDTPDNFRSKLELVDIATKQASTLFESKGKDDRITALSWSPDGRYVAFEHEGKVKFYDFSKRAVINQTITVEDIGSSDQSYGWL